MLRRRFLSGTKLVTLLVSIAAAALQDSQLFFSFNHRLAMAFGTLRVPRPTVAKVSASVCHLAFGLGTPGAEPLLKDCSAARHKHLKVSGSNGKGCHVQLGAA